MMAWDDEIHGILAEFDAAAIESGGQAMKALLVTGDTQYAARLSTELSQLPQPIAVQTAAAPAALEQLAADRPDVAILDLTQLPSAGATVPSLVETMRQAAPQLAIVAIVGQGLQLAADAIAAGADAFVRQDA